MTTVKPIPTQPPYSILSRYYDQITRSSAGMSGHARRKVLGRILPKAQVVCDLGCGTGTTAVELARSGKKVYAVDASAGQCKQARAKSRAAKVDARVICADMRRFKLPEPVDLVLCEFNPLNHLGRKQDIHLAFRSVARALKPAGWFYFDLNMFPTYKAYYPIVRWEEHEGFCLVSRGGIDVESAKAWLDLEWFVAKRDGWQRYRERIEDTWWTDAEIRAALRAVGFVDIRAWDGVEIRPKKMKSKRGFDRYYLARKA